MHLCGSCERWSVGRKMMQQLVDDRESYSLLSEYEKATAPSSNQP